MLTVRNKRAILAALDPVHLDNRTCFLPLCKDFRGHLNIGGRCEKKVRFKDLKNATTGTKHHYARLKEQFQEVATDQAVRAVVEQYISNVSCNIHSELKLGTDRYQKVFPDQALRNVEQRVATFMPAATPPNSVSTHASLSPSTNPPAAPLDTIASTSPISLPSMQIPTIAQQPVQEALFVETHHACRSCYKVFATADDLFFHSMACRTLVGYLFCCGQSFDSTDALVQHHAQRHVPVTSLQCCNQAFATIALWKEHYDAFHSDLTAATGFDGFFSPSSFTDEVVGGNEGITRGGQYDFSSARGDDGVDGRI